MHDHLGAGKRILLEPGRALIANAGVTLYRVGTVKPSASPWVAVDGGMSDNLRPMLYGARYQAEIADRFGGGTPCQLVGKHCESGDVIVADAPTSPTPGRATWSSRPPRAPTATRWPTTTTACRGRRWSSAATATRAWSSGARPTTTC